MTNVLMIAAVILIGVVILTAKEYGDAAPSDDCARESLFLRLDAKTPADRAKVTALCREFSRQK